METEPQNHSPILDLAWKRYANFSAHSGRRKNGFYSMRGWIAVLGILATLTAILSQVINDNWLKGHPGFAWFALFARIVFITTPVIASLLAAFASKKYANGDWWVTRAAAEEIKKEIYFYRTIWPKNERNKMLETSLENIQRQVYRALGGVFSLEEPKPKKNKENKQPAPQAGQRTTPARDHNFDDLTGDLYFQDRLEDQLNWHNNKINQLKVDRDRMTIAILAVGALGTVLATWGGQLGILVALTASITAALIGWEQLKSNETVIRNYSKVVLELSILRDRWLNLDRTKLKSDELQSEFQKLVNNCESVLWAQNAEYVKAMRDVLKENSLDEQAKLAENAIQGMVVSYQSTTHAMEDQAVQTINATVTQTGQQVQDSYQATLGSLQQDASELVQKQLDAVSQAVSDAAENLVERAPTLSSIVEKIKQDYSHVEIGRDTSKEQINEILASYPKTSEVKG